MPPEQGTASRPALSAVVRDVRSLGMMLRAIAFTPLCQVTISDFGLQVITEVDGVLQATAYLHAGLFAEYQYDPPLEDLSEVEEGDAPSSVFETSLNDLLVCLNIYGNAGITVPSKAKESEDEARKRKERERQALLKGIHLDTEMRLVYQGNGFPLVVQLYESNTSTRCELATFEANTTLITDIPFLSDRVMGQVIMQSKDLTEALLSLDSSSKEVTISFLQSSHPATAQQRAKPVGNDDSSLQDSRGNSSLILSTADTDDEGDDGKRQTLKGRNMQSESVQMLKIKSEGDSGSTELELPNRHKLFQQFTCSQNSSNTFQFANLQRCIKALQTSLKVSLRVDDEGVMSLQCLFPRRPEQVAEPYADASRTQQTDAEKHGFVELKILPIAMDDDRD